MKVLLIVFGVIATAIVLMLLLVWLERRTWRRADKIMRERMQREATPFRPVTTLLPTRSYIPGQPERRKVVTAPKVKDRTPTRKPDDPDPYSPIPIALASGALFATMTDATKADETPQAAKFESGGGDFGGSGRQHRIVTPQQAPTAAA